jgi:hypothetical protein
VPVEPPELDAPVLPVELALPAVEPELPEPELPELDVALEPDDDAPVDPEVPAEPEHAGRTHAIATSIAVFTGHPIVGAAT